MTQSESAAVINFNAAFAKLKKAILVKIGAQKSVDKKDPESADALKEASANYDAAYTEVHNAAAGLTLDEIKNLQFKSGGGRRKSRRSKPSKRSHRKSKRRHH